MVKMKTKPSESGKSIDKLYLDNSQMTIKELAHNWVGLMGKMKTKPPHPGEIIKKYYLEDSRMTVTELAQKAGVCRRAVSRIINARQPITTMMSVEISKVLKTDPIIFLSIQNTYDIWVYHNEERIK